jgi:hypothetical protein
MEVAPPHGILVTIIVVYVVVQKTTELVYDNRGVSADTDPIYYEYVIVASTTRLMVLHVAGIRAESIGGVRKLSTSRTQYLDTRFQIDSTGYQ